MGIAQNRNFVKNKTDIIAISEVKYSTDRASTTEFLFSCHFSNGRTMMKHDFYLQPL